MTEKLLQFIWKHRYFNNRSMELASGESLIIDFPGYMNPNQGPDFLDARIRIDGNVWAGHVELHLRTSLWNKHAHQHDLNYDNVILHVVWENDAACIRRNIPLLELRDRVSGMMLKKYSCRMIQPSFIPCMNGIHLTSEALWTAWKEKLIIEKLDDKTRILQKQLGQNNQHWEELLWWMVAGNFGLTVNASSFRAIAKSISLNILAKHKYNPLQLEAILFGQAGLLNKTYTDAYPKMLQKEFIFLKGKYGLKPIFEQVHFLRMRPENFPTIRLSQLAAFISSSAHLFARIRESDHLHSIRKMLIQPANDYWHYHYVFDISSSYKEKILGRQMADNILINGIIPILYCYGKIQHDQAAVSKSIEWLRSIPPEKNKFSKQWNAMRIKALNAADSQSLLMLKNRYCDENRCLECAVGQSLLRDKFDNVAI